LDFNILNETKLDPFDNTDSIYLMLAKMINSNTFNEETFIKHCESFLYSGYDIDLLFVTNTNLKVLPIRNVKLCELLWNCYNITIKRNINKVNYGKFVFDMNENQCRIKFTIYLCETTLKVLYPNDKDMKFGGYDVLTNKDKYLKFINKLYNVFFAQIRRITKYLLENRLHQIDVENKKEVINIIH